MAGRGLEHGRALLRAGNELDSVVHGQPHGTPSVWCEATSRLPLPGPDGAAGPEGAQLPAAIEELLTLA